MCSCDYDLPSVFRESWPTAKRPHACCECGSSIDPGEKYYRASGVWNKERSTHHMCMVCRSVLNEAEAEIDDLCICLGQLWETVGVEFEYAACSG